MSHFVLKQGGRVLNVIPNAMGMDRDTDERACCVVVQQCCCWPCLFSCFGVAYYAIADCIESIESQREAAAHEKDVESAHDVFLKNQQNPPTGAARGLFAAAQNEAQTEDYI